MYQIVSRTRYEEVLKMELCSEKEQNVLDILSEKQLKYIATHTSKPGSQIVGYHLKLASEQGVAGFLGDHYKVTLCINEDDLVRKIYLFIKAMPKANQQKADVVTKNQLFTKEALVFTLLNDIQSGDYQQPWCTKPIIYNDTILVMPDLTTQGYKTHPKEVCFDENHVLLAVSSLARFHATFANYFTKKLNKNSPSDIVDEFRLIVTENIWESTWLRTAGKLTVALLKEFSSKSMKYSVGLEDKLWKLYTEGSDSLKHSEDSLNVIIHRDLWANNIMFLYTDDVPVNAVLIDFQLIRYAPPAFDLMTLLYLNTSRTFRDSSEKRVLRHYFTVFSDNLEDDTKRRLGEMNYDFEALLDCCEKARLFAFVQALVVFPFVLMEPGVAQKTFDDPDTYLEYMNVDRSAPVIAHAREHDYYRLRQIEVSEEFVEMYVT